MSRKKVASHGSNSSNPADREMGLVGALLGCFLGLGYLKWGNPIVLEHRVSLESDGFGELMFSTWPLNWGYLGAVVIGLLALIRVQAWTLRPGWILAAPVVWFGWQMIALIDTIDWELSQYAMKHFLALSVVYLVGLSFAPRLRNPNVLLAGVVLAYLIALWKGFGQHYGGLEATREYVKSLPNWESLPEAYKYRIERDRIFATFVYPNAFAGMILLVGPVAGYCAWRWGERLGRIGRLTLVCIVAYMSLACLYWTGSKTGLAIASAMGVFVFLHLPIPKRLRAIAGVMMLVGAGGLFTWKFSDYFESGAGSLEARFDYWAVAADVALERPINGSGPGTFFREYSERKDPESEMTRLAHNDYLQQVSDGGFMGGLLYIAIMPVPLVWLYLRCRQRATGLQRVLWIGATLWALQSLMEFGLYIPALAWTGFLWVSWLVGSLAMPGAPHVE